VENNSQDLLEIKNLSKSFPGVQALDRVDLSLYGGEVHGLIGENGAGKSTLIKILMGVYQRDSGSIAINGNEVEISNPYTARKYGLSAVYQDVAIAPDLTVGENFFIGKLPTNRLGFVNWKYIYSESQSYLKKLDININPRLKIVDLLPGQQEMVTIAKIVRDKTKFVIFDEPTARLTNEETETLFSLIKRLKNEGLGIIYISHRVEEIFDICDRITVLRDGKLVGTKSIKEVDEDKLIAMMVGRSIEEMYDIEHPPVGKIQLEVRNLSKKLRFDNISFQLHCGEVLGFFGLVGSGRTNVLRSVFGADQYDSGEILLKGEKIKNRTPNSAMKRGIGLVPEERKLQGLAMPLSVKHNINITTYRENSILGFIKLRVETNQAKKIVDNLNIRTPTLNQLVENLSGGNQQKVAIGKWLCRNSDILLLDEPTTGVDVGAKVEIYHLIESLIKMGKAIILCSSYLPEVIGLSNRILVMAEGKLAGIVDKKDANEESILKLASKTSLRTFERK
jgi:ribose transport system ATP-binding protein